MFMKEFLEALELNFWKKQFKENKTSSGKASKRR